MRRLKFHIAARWRRRGEALALAEELEKNGHGITSSWLQQTTGLPSLEDMVARRVHGEGIDLNALADHQRIQLAEQAVGDVERCDALVLLTEPEGGSRRNTRLIQAGYALGRGKRVYFMGKSGENVINCHPAVIHVLDKDGLLKDLHSRGECNCQELHDEAMNNAKLRLAEMKRRFDEAREKDVG